MTVFSIPMDGNGLQIAGITVSAIVLYSCAKWLVLVIENDASLTS